MKRRTLLVAAASAAAVARAQSAWPTRAIRHIVPFPAAGVTDVFARHQADKLSTELGQRVLVENRAGAAGITGLTVGMAAAPDGYTTMDAGLGTHVFNPMVYRRLSYNPVNDFVPVSLLSSFSPALLVPVSSGYRSVNDVVAAARARPGEIAFGSSGYGSPGHIILELFQRTFDIKVLHVPFAGDAPGFLAMASGNIQGQFGFPIGALSFIQDNRIRALAVAGPKRLKITPDAPTMRELGFPDLQIPTWRGMFVPRGTPADIVTRLAAAIRVVNSRPETIEFLERSGAESLWSTPEQLARQIQDDTARWKPVIERAKITID